MTDSISEPVWVMRRATDTSIASYSIELIGHLQNAKPSVEYARYKDPATARYERVPKEIPRLC